ncbi:MAG: hypothetical protein RLO52_43885 [Sandaracinaceae bacterium]
MRARVGVACDEASARSAMRDHLRGAGFAVSSAGDLPGLSLLLHRHRLTRSRLDALVVEPSDGPLGVCWTGLESLRLDRRGVPVVLVAAPERVGETLRKRLAAVSIVPKTSPRTLDLITQSLGYLMPLAQR